MTSLEILRRLYRMYFSWYRIEHDRSLATPRSIWSLEAALQPPTPRQALHLETVLSGGGWVDSHDGMMLKAPLATVASPPRLDRLLGFAESGPGLAGTKVQVQLFLAPEDPEFRRDFERHEGWEWLSSSVGLTELFLVGVLTDEGLEVLHLFHSCYRAELHREAGEDLLRALRYWDHDCAEVTRLAGPGPEVEPDGWLPALVEAVPPPPRERYRFPCADGTEARRLGTLCRDVGLEKVREVKAVGTALESRLEPMELVGVVSYLRYGSGLHLFKS